MPFSTTLMSDNKPKKKKNTGRKLPRGANPGVFESKKSDLASAVVHNAVHMPDGSLPVLPSLSGQDQPLVAYASRLAEESELYFPRFAQDHFVLLQQRRYAPNGDLTEQCSVIFGSSTLSNEEAVAMLEGAIELTKSGFDFRLAKGDENADPLAFMQAPPQEEDKDDATDTLQDLNGPDEHSPEGDEE